MRTPEELAEEAAGVIEGDELRGKALYDYLVGMFSPDAPVMQPVVSGQISSVGRDQGGLLVEFKNGDRYRYDAVPDADFDKLLGAFSVGKYFHAHIKPYYRCTKIE